MAIGDTTNPNLFGTDYNAGEEERKRLEAEASSAAQNARIGAGGVGAPSDKVVTQLPPMQEPTPLDVAPTMTNDVANGGMQLREPKQTDGGTLGLGSVDVESPFDITGTLDFSNLNLNGVNLQIPPELQFKKPGTGEMGLTNLFNEGSLPRMVTEAAGATGDFAIDKTKNLAEFLTGQSLSAGDKTASEVEGSLAFLQSPEVQASMKAAQGQQGTLSVDQALEDGTGTSLSGTEEQQESPELEIRRGEEGSPQGYFNAITDERPLTPEEIKLGKAFADRKGFDFNPQTGFSVIDNPGARVFDTPATLENFQARGLDVGQFMRYEDDPSQRTEQFVDEQGRLRRRLTRDAATLQEFSPERIAQDRPLAPEFAQAEATGDQMIADLRAKEAAEAKGREGKMSYTDAKRRARGEFAAKNIDPSPSQLRKLAKGIQAAEPERLEGLETERALKEARIKTEEAELNKPEFKGKVYTVDGVTFAQLSNGSAQVISTGTEDPEKTTREAEKFEFTKKKIEDARKAYEEGDLTKSNDILAAANIQQYGIQANATQYFADSTPQVTPPAPQVTGSGLTQQQEARINLVMGTNPTRSRAEVIEAMQKEGKL